MKRIVVSPGLIGQTVATLTGKELHYVVHVLRMNKGDAVMLVDGSGVEYVGCISEIGADCCSVDITERRQAERATGASVKLLYGLSRAERCEFVLQKATELNISHIVLAICERSVSRPDPIERKRARWEEIIRQAARQSGRADFPTLLLATNLTDAIALVIDDERDAPGSAVRWVADPHGPPLATHESRITADVHTQSHVQSHWLAIGPEGGFSQAEMARLTRAAFLPFRLGSTTLRTETAVVACVAVMQYLLETKSR